MHSVLPDMWLPQGATMDDNIGFLKQCLAEMNKCVGGRFAGGGRLRIQNCIDRKADECVVQRGSCRPRPNTHRHEKMSEKNICTCPCTRTYKLSHTCSFRSAHLVLVLGDSRA